MVTEPNNECRSTAKDRPATTIVLQSTGNAFIEKTGRTIPTFVIFEGARGAPTVVSPTVVAPTQNRRTHHRHRRDRPRHPPRPPPLNMSDPTHSPPRPSNTPPFPVRTPLSTSGSAIAATVEAAFERAVPDLMHEWSHAVRDAARAAAATCEGLLATGDDQSTRNYEAEQCNGPRSTNMAAGRRRRWVRQDISIGVKKQIVRLRDANITWPFIFRQLPVPGTKRNAQKTVEDAAFYRAIPNDARTLSSNNRRGAKWPKLDALVYERYLAVFTRGLRIC